MEGNAINKNLSIIILEDNPADVELVLYQLKKNGLAAQVKVASNEAEFKALLTSFCDVILADYSLPQYSALRALEYVQASNLDIPFIVVSGSIGEEVAVEIIKRGATDYLLKDRLGRLGSAVVKAVEEKNSRAAQAAIEIAFQKSEQRYHSLFNNSPTIMLFVETTTGTIVDANPSAEHFFNLPPKKLLGKKLASFDDAPHKLSEILLGQASSNQVVSFQSQQRLADNRIHTVEVSGCLLPMEEGSVLFVSITDITEKKELEEQLRQSQKLEAIGSLSGGIAHDLNNILTAIIGNTSLLKRKIDPGGPSEKYVDRINEATERAVTLTKGLLAFSRKQVLDPEVVDLNATIESITQLLERLIGEDILFRLNLVSDELKVLADKSQVEQIVMNLAVNARDAMPEGGTLEIATGLAPPPTNQFCREGTDPPNYALMSVSDTGHGMVSATMARMFEPFFTSKEVGKGTGLGLSTVHGIVSQHNGLINCDSSPGQGTTFNVYFPLTSTRTEITAVNELYEVGGSESILIVEDDPDVRQPIKEILSAAGYPVIEAENAHHALRLFQTHNHQIDLVLLDVIMPGKNGKQLLDELLLIRPELKAIFISGHADNIIQRSGIDDQQLHFLAKPINPSDLLRKIRSVIDEP